jgi:hypothetical protein
MEINYFRLGIFRNWYQMERAKRKRERSSHRLSVGDDREDECSHDMNDVVEHGFLSRDEVAIVSDVVVGLDETDNTKILHTNTIQVSSAQHDAMDEEVESKSSSGVKQLPSEPSSNAANQQINLLQDVIGDDNNNTDDGDISSIDEEAISSILLDSNILTNQLCDHASVLSSIRHHQGANQDLGRSILNNSYSTIRKSSLFTILFWIVLYFATAVGIIVNTRGLEEKVVAIIGGASKFVAAVLVFIVSAKIPQWVSYCVYIIITCNIWMCTVISDCFLYPFSTHYVSHAMYIYSSVYTIKDPSS